MGTFPKIGGLRAPPRPGPHWLLCAAPLVVEEYAWRVSLTLLRLRSGCD